MRPLTLNRRGIALAAAALLTIGLAAPTLSSSTAEAAPTATQSSVVVQHKTVEIDGLEIFYLEAGDPTRPTVLLLHGFPTSSQMFRNLIPVLAQRYHVLAPDYPGFGHSAMPLVGQYDYTFDNLAQVVEGFLAAKGVDRFSVYLMDYGAPVGFRLFQANPERVDAFTIQNGNAYLEGLPEFWDPIRALWASGNAVEQRDTLRGFLTLDGTKWQYVTGEPDPSVLSPDAWITDQFFLDRPGNAEIQLDLFYDYRTNLDLYPTWQALFRQHQPPTIILWGKNDPIFPEAGAHPYKCDLTNVEFHLIDAGHFVLESNGALMADEILEFLDREVDST